MTRRGWIVPLASAAAVTAVVLAATMTSGGPRGSRSGAEPAPAAANSKSVSSSAAPEPTEPASTEQTATTDSPSASATPTRAVSSSPAASPVVAGVVPWTDTQGHPQVYAPGTTTTMPLRPCMHSDLTLRYDEVGSVGDGAAVVVTNNSNTSCAVDGAPEFEVVGASEPLTIRYRSPYRFPQRPPGRLAPGESAHADAWPVRCTDNDEGRHQATVPTRISVANAGTFAVDARAPDVQCGLYVDGFTKGDRLPPPAPIADVVLAIDSPDQVRAGDALLFTVELTNPTRAPIPLTPCPTYSMYVVPDGPSIERTFELNCAAAPDSIGPLGTVRFGMRLDIPAAFPTGPALKFVWELETEALSGESGLPLEILPAASS